MPGSQLEEVGESPDSSHCNTSDCKKGDSFTFCPWSSETSEQPGHRAPELHTPVTQPIVASEGGKKNWKLQTGEDWEGVPKGQG